MKVIQGKLCSLFGGRRDPIDGSYKVHQGVDIAAPVGTPVYSPCDGVISSTYNHISGGLTIVVRSDCGLIRFAMCHLAAFEVEAGCEVGRGDLIARSGNTGRSTGPHLHFSVKTGGRWRGEQYVGGGFVDPVPYMEF